MRRPGTGSRRKKRGAAIAAPLRYYPGAGHLLPGVVRGPPEPGYGRRRQRRLVHHDRGRPRAPEVRVAIGTNGQPGAAHLAGARAVGRAQAAMSARMSPNLVMAALIHGSCSGSGAVSACSRC